MDTDFRYLGAHLTTRHSPTSATLDTRLEKALTQLKRLRYVPADVEAKVGIILAKTYAAALYGVEAAKVQPAKLAKRAAAVVNAFRGKNTNRNTDRFYTTLTGDAKDLDPVVQIYGRRALQVRRTCSKDKEAERRIKETIVRYATRHKRGEAWPTWYYDEEWEAAGGPEIFPQPQPHPSTNEHSEDWDKDIDAIGPIGLLIESIVWCGLVIDKDLNVWQKQEEPVNILSMPYQNLKAQLHMQAARARTNAEWNRDSTTRMVGLREIDRQASLVGAGLTEEEKGVVRTIQMGGTMSKQNIAAFNEDVDTKCSYCQEATASGIHIRWQCKYFEQTRVETDKELAQVPRHYLLDCIRCGVAPAMKVEGELTYWGMKVDDKETEETKAMLGVSNELRTGGENGDITRKREQAIKLIEDPQRGRRNASQTMLKHKMAHGSGTNPEIPTEKQVEEAMADFAEDYFVPAFGDGSLTTPKTWWAALGGYGVWIPGWNKQGENEASRKEEHIFGPTIGPVSYTHLTLPTTPYV